MKTGDWVIHDYEIVQIVEMEDGRVTEISSGHLELQAGICRLDRLLYVTRFMLNIFSICIRN